MSLLTSLDLPALYLLYKAGQACRVLTLAFFLLGVCGVCIMVVDPCTDAHKRTGLRIVLFSCIFFALFGSCAALAPSSDDLKNIAVYKLASRLTDKADAACDALITHLTK